MPPLFSSPPLCYSSFAPLFHARCCWSWLLQFPAPPPTVATQLTCTQILYGDIFFFLVYVLPEWKIYELRDEILEGKKIQVGSFQSWEHWKVELAHAHAHTPQAVCPPSIIRVNTVELAFKWWSLWTIFLSSVLYHSAFGVSALSQCFHSIPASGILASLLFLLLHYSCHKGTRLPFGGEKSNNP